MSQDKIVYDRISLYIPKTISNTIDLKRVDVPKSKFIQRIIEKHFNLGEQK
jgi:hypothetical protein